MATAFRANALGNDGITATTTTVAVTIPAGAAIGDVALVVLENNASATTISAAPSGWTLKSGPDDNTSSNTWLYSKTIASGEPGSAVTWTFSASTRPVATMTVFSGGTETGMTVATPNTDTSSVSSLTVPTIASVPSGAAVVALFGRNRSATTGTPADVTSASPYSQGASERAATNFTGGTNASTEVAYQLAASAGSYGGESLSITGGTSRGTTYLVAIPALATDVNAPTPTAFVGVSATAPTPSTVVTTSIDVPSAYSPVRTQDVSVTASGTASAPSAFVSVFGDPATPGTGTLIPAPTAFVQVFAPDVGLTGTASVAVPTALAQVYAQPIAAGTVVALAVPTALIPVRTAAATPATFYRYQWWNGSAWRPVMPVVWDGAAWIEIPVTVTAD